MKIQHLLLSIVGALSLATLAACGGADREFLHLVRSSVRQGDALGSQGDVLFRLDETVDL